jgi:hypothetical protein
LVLGYLLGEWQEHMRPHTGWVRTTAEVAGFMLAWVGLVALPLWVLSLVRVG